MASYSLSGSGTHALTANTTGLQVTITTPSSIGGSGRSNPVAKYDQGLLRFSDGTSYWPPVPVLGGPQFVPVPANATSIGYALLGGAVVSVVEVIGGTLFFSAPTGGTSTLVSHSAQLGGDVAMASVGTAYDGPSVSCGAGTWLVLATLFVEENSGAGGWLAKLWDGSTVYASMAGQASGGYWTCAIVGIAVLTGTTTIKASVVPNTGASKIHAASPWQSAGNNVSGIVAVQIA